MFTDIPINTLKHLLVYFVGKMFQSKHLVDGHVMRMHEKDKLPLECATCGKRFRHPTMLLAHERVHTGETPFQCHTCGEHFRCDSKGEPFKLWFLLIWWPSHWHVLSLSAYLREICGCCLCFLRIRKLCSVPFVCLNVYWIDLDRTCWGWIQGDSYVTPIVYIILWTVTNQDSFQCK